MINTCSAPRRVVRSAPNSTFVLPGLKELLRQGWKERASGEGNDKEYSITSSVFISAGVDKGLLIRRYNVGQMVLAQHGIDSPPIWGHESPISHKGRQSLS